MLTTFRTVSQPPVKPSYVACRKDQHDDHVLEWLSHRHAPPVTRSMKPRRLWSGHQESLTPSQLAECLQLRSAGWTFKALGERYVRAERTIRNLCGSDPALDCRRRRREGTAA